MELVRLIIFMLTFALVCSRFNEMHGFSWIALGCASILAVTQLARIYLKYKGRPTIVGKRKE